MNDNNVYGLVINHVFHSNRMEFKTAPTVANGIYALDMTRDDFKESMTPADIDSAIRFFRKASKIKVFRGISFHDGVIPENPVSFKQIPIRVIDATYDDFEEVEVAMLQNGTCYFIRVVTTDKAYPLMDVKTAFEEEKGNVEGVKGVSPEIHIAYIFQVLEREEQRRLAEIARLEGLRREAAARRIRAAGERTEALRKAAELQEAELQVYIRQLGEPADAIRRGLETSGAKMISIKRVNRGYEVAWSAAGQRINSLFDHAARVIQGGFCMSGYDETQSATSIAKVLQDYVRDGSHIYITRDDGHQHYRRNER